MSKKCRMQNFGRHCVSWILSFAFCITPHSTLHSPHFTFCRCSLSVITILFNKRQNVNRRSIVAEKYEQMFECGLIIPAVYATIIGMIH